MIPVSDIDLFLFDMDGTIYLGEQLFPFTKELLATIRRQGKRYLFMTNNSSKSVSAYVAKMERLGIPASAEDFITSAQATADYLLRTYPDRYFYVGGTRSLLEEFRTAGLRVTGDPDDAINAVVLGFDTELTFEKLDFLARILLRDIPYIATHPDLVCPTEYGSVPDLGAICEMLAHATKRTPYVVGKPKPLMPELAMRRVATSPARTLVVGDRLNTDIACGVNAGTHTLLVYTGEATPADLAASPVKPTEAWESAACLLDALCALDA